MLSLFSSLISWIFRGSVVKWVIFTGLALLLAPLMELLLSLIDSSGLDGIPSLVNALPEGIRFYLVLFRLDIGLPMLVAAYLTKFFIRRLPIVG